MSLHLKPGQLTLADLRQAYLAPVRLSLDPSADAPIAASVACVENIIAEGRTAYGINTGFGLLASTRISRPTWRSSSVPSSCPMPPASARRWTTPWCGWSCCSR